MTSSTPADDTHAAPITVPLSGLRAAGCVAGRYRLLRKLKAGGMGVVYVAHHVMLECDVALKVMNDVNAAYSDGAMRFEREARALAQLGRLSDHAVHVMDYGIEDGVPYIVMELLHGEDLGARLDAGGPIPPAEAVRIAFQLMRVLQKAHQLGLVHRDLKPDNIFLARRDEEESVKLLDFGALKDLGASPHLTRPTVIGTLPYMAPEQLQGRHVDCRTDLWALAVVLFQMITGRLPFKGSSIAELVGKICYEPAPAPSVGAPHLRGLDAFFSRAFAPRPEERYPSVEDLVRCFAEGLRFSLPPPSSSGAPRASIPGPPAVPGPPATSSVCDPRAPSTVDSAAPTVRSLV